MASTTAKISVDKPFGVIFAGLAAIVVLIGIARLAGVQPPPSLPLVAATQTREIMVEDGALGSVIVRDAKTGVMIKTYKSGEGSFLRATLRALVNGRKHQGLSSQGNFRLESYAGPQLFLTDEVSGKTLSMNAFGPTNTAVFAADRKSVV